MKEKYCKECGELLEDWEDDICDNCKDNLASSILYTEEIWPSMDDL